MVLALIGPALTGGSLARSGDGGLTWQTVVASRVASAYFDASNPGTVYSGSRGDAPLRSVDDGQTWTALGTAGLPPQTVGNASTVIADPNQAGHLILLGVQSFQSTDGGNAWTEGQVDVFGSVVPDWSNGVIYASDGYSVAVLPAIFSLKVI